MHKVEPFSITYSSVVSSGIEVGTAVSDFSRQSTMPSAQRHGCGQVDRAPHSIGAFSVKPGRVEWFLVLNCEFFKLFK